MSFGAVLLLIAVTGGILSCVAWCIEWISVSRWFRWGGLALFLSLLILMQARMSSFHFYDLVLIIAACGCWTVFFAYFFMNAFAKTAPGAVVSRNRLRVPPSYSEAEAAAVRKDFQEALRLYREAAMRYPDEPEPRRRMAELFLKLNMPDDAIVSFRDAEARHRDPDDKLLTTFAIAETLVERKNDVPGAIKVITDLLRQHPEVAGRVYAEGRLSKLRALMTAEPPARR